jgi:1,2-diacylglycerol 3-beta-galactosyltransferase
MNQQTNAKKHILFLFSDTGGGHRSAAEALIEALDLEYGAQISTEMVDFFADYTPWPFNTFTRTYPDMVKVPQAWGFGYLISNGRRRVRMLFNAIYPYARRGIVKLVEEHPADAIVSVHPLVTDTALRVMGESHPPYIQVVTDLVTTHAFWYHPKVDLTIVPTQPAYDRAMKNQLDPATVEHIGLPVADRFCRPTEGRATLREQLGWPQDLPMILIVGGGDGMGPLEQTARAIADAGLEAGLAVVTGRNAPLKTRLEAYKWTQPTFLYGFVRNMPTLMHAADILVTKAGPGTVSEALNTGLPMALYNYLPGQEEGNVTYVVEQGAGVWTPKPDQIVAAIRTWLEDDAAYQRALQACKTLARPQAARQIAHRIAHHAGLAPPQGQ